MTHATRPTTCAAHLIVRMGSYAWRVEVGQTLGLGRHPSNDVVVSGECASRFHARVRWDGDLPYLEDLGSVNGTWVDGTRLHGQRILQDGERIRVGDSTLVAELPAAREAAPALLLDSGDELALFSESRRELRGAIGSRPALHRLLLELETGKRTGSLRLSAGGHVSCLTFCLGKVVGARHQGRVSLDAVARIFQTAQASYRFSADFEACETALCVSPRDYLRKGHWATARQQRSKILNRLVG